MKILILEDDPERHKLFRRNLIGHEVVITTTSENCIDFLQSNEYDILMLDHDLGFELYQIPGDKTGYGVVKWIVQHKERCPKQIFVHSLNGPAANMMINLFTDNGIKAQHVPFLWIKLGENNG